MLSVKNRDSNSIEINEYNCRLPLHNVAKELKASQSDCI